MKNSNERGGNGGEFGLRPHVALSLLQNPFIFLKIITRPLAESKKIFSENSAGRKIRWRAKPD
jgi:hypothetical protein